MVSSSNSIATYLEFLSYSATAFYSILTELYLRFYISNLNRTYIDPFLQYLYRIELDPFELKMNVKVNPLDPTL